MIICSQAKKVPSFISGTSSSTHTCRGMFNFLVQKFLFEIVGDELPLSLILFAPQRMKLKGQR